LHWLGGLNQQSWWKIIPAKVIDKIVAVNIIMWRLKINNKLFYLVFDDYPVMMSLEPIDNNLDNEILRIFNLLKNIKPQQIKTTIIALKSSENNKIICLNLASEIRERITCLFFYFHDDTLTGF
jgi:hypothetical protein